MRAPKTEPTHAFLRACFGLPTDYTPTWIMRQAGRYLPEYRAVRSKVSFLELCQTPELAAEVTLQPIDRLGVDAAILFSDILPPAQAMGLDLSFEGGPPKISPPVRSQADVDRLVVPDPTEGLGYVLDAVRLIRRELNDRVPLIGFCGAPFTMASYMVEGGGTKSFAHLKGLIFGQPKVYTALMDKIADTTAAYLNAQIEAGAQAVQIFDSWAGALSPEDFRTFALPWVQRVIEQLKGEDVPVIYFVGEAGTLLEAMGEAGADVLGVDWRVPMSEVLERVGPDQAIQGNLDPCTLFAPIPEIERRAGALLETVGARPGHIFNLGHGILPQVDPDHAKALVDFVHQRSRELRAHP